MLFLNWAAANLATFLLVIIAVFAVFYAIWLRLRLRVSKARFALAAMTIQVSCIALFPVLVIGQNGLISSLLIAAAEKYDLIEKQPVIDPVFRIISVIIPAILCAYAIVLIRRICQHTIEHWDGPTTVSVSELSKEKKDNDQILLAISQINKILSGKDDPISGKSTYSWEKSFSPAPLSLEWKILAKSLFSSLFTESEIDDAGWRESLSAWSGIFYTDETSTPSPLLLVPVYDTFTTKDAIEYCKKHVNNENTIVFFATDENIVREEILIDTRMRIISKLSMIHKTLNLKQYAKSILHQFNMTLVGGTTATLAETFTPPHAREPNSEQRTPLSNIIDEWLADTTRRHLAITGEYGQGKSTAMLSFCATWAESFLKDPNDCTNIPLLIELRGKSPSDMSPTSFLATWATRYNMHAEQLMNIIRSGNAILIFEGFDELKNAGRAYDRHEHFNALWKLAYPGNKLLFTGRPNFFLDEKERNKTLRADTLNGAGSNAYTEVWELCKLTIEEISNACKPYAPNIHNAIVDAAEKHKGFFEIASRPSMLPVVATIWPTIQKLHSDGHSLTSAVLIEQYLQATYKRKEEEIEQEILRSNSSREANYLILPREIRETLTMCVAWKMAGTASSNTIERSEFNQVISDCFEILIAACKSNDPSSEINEWVARFEEKYKDDNTVDKIEIITTDVATSGILVSDPAGGPTNLRFPHKQFYEYTLSRAFWITIENQNSWTTKLLRSTHSASSPYAKILTEPQTSSYLLEIFGEDLSQLANARTLALLRALYLFGPKEAKNTQNRENTNKNEPKNISKEIDDLSIRMMKFVAGLSAVSFVVTISLLSIDGTPKEVAIIPMTVSLGMLSVFSMFMFYGKVILPPIWSIMVMSSYQVHHNKNVKEQEITTKSILSNAIELTRKKRDNPKGKSLRSSLAPFA